MNIHPEAWTTPKIRAEIQASKLGVKALAKKYNISVLTVRKWKSRQAVQDTSHCPHHLQTTLSAAQELLVVERLVEKAAFTITTILTDNGKEFTDKFCSTGQREPTGKHEFYVACLAAGI